MQELTTVFYIAAKDRGCDHLHPQLYSLRHGGASHDALHRRRPLGAIKKRGHWQSDNRVWRYEKAAVAQRDSQTGPSGHSLRPAGEPEPRADPQGRYGRAEAPDGSCCRRRGPSRAAPLGIVFVGCGSVRSVAAVRRLGISAFIEPSARCGALLRSLPPAWGCCIRLDARSSPTFRRSAAALVERHPAILHSSWPSTWKRSAESELWARRRRRWARVSAHNTQALSAVQLAHDLLDRQWYDSWRL